MEHRSLSPMNLEILREGVSNVRRLLVQRHDVMHVGKNQAIFEMCLLFLIIEIPKLASLISHFDEWRFFCDFELLLKHFLLSLGWLRVIWLDDLWHVHLDHHIVDVGPYLSTITLRGLSPICTFSPGNLLLFVLDLSIVLPKYNDLLIDETLHPIGNKFLPASLLEKLLGRQRLHLSLLLSIGVLHVKFHLLSADLVIFADALVALAILLMVLMGRGRIIFVFLFLSSLFLPLLELGQLLSKSCRFHSQFHELFLLNWVLLNHLLLH